jgi:glycosyltransferase involved in cell wall biosynthesis
LATLLENEGEKFWVEELKNNGIVVQTTDLTKSRIIINTLSSLLSNKPIQSNYSWEPDLYAFIEKTLADNPDHWDIIHVEHLRGAQYGIKLFHFLKEKKIKIPLIWDSVDCISSLFRQASKHSRSFFGRWITRFELPKTLDYETYALEYFDRVLVTSENDRKHLINLQNQISSHSQKRFPDISVIANGVDLEYFSPCSSEVDSDIIIFTGKLSYHANFTAALYLVEKIMPIIWDQKPWVVLNLVGKDPPKTLIRHSEKDNRIRVTGMVPDIREYICQSCLAVAPLQYGAGIQNKVLEAMACAIPVIANGTAVSALSAIPGQDFFRADDPHDFAKSIIYLLDNPDKRAQIGKKAREFVETNHDWYSVIKHLEMIYMEVNEFNAT